MVQIPRVDVRASFDEQISNPARASEMERRLAVATALVDPGRIGVEHLLQELETIEVGGGTCIRNRARGEETLRNVIACAVQRMEPPGPPVAPPVGVRAKLE